MFPIVPWRLNLALAPGDSLDGSHTATKGVVCVRRRRNRQSRRYNFRGLPLSFELLPIYALHLPFLTRTQDSVTTPMLLGSWIGFSPTWTLYDFNGTHLNHSSANKQSMLNAIKTNTCEYLCLLMNNSPICPAWVSPYGTNIGGKDQIEAAVSNVITLTEH